MMLHFQSLTLLRLIFIGFVVVILPLAAAIFTAIHQADTLARTSREALVTVQSETDTSRLLASRLTDMERSARQYAASGDRDYLLLYLEHQREGLALLDQLSRVNTSATAETSLDRIKAAVLAVNQLVEASNPAGSVPGLDQAFQRLREGVGEVLTQYNQRARDLANQMPEQAGQLQNVLLGQAALVLPLSSALAVIFVVLARRPLRQLDSSIRNLGRGALEQSIQVSGTRDLVELGQRLDWLRVRLRELEHQKTLFLRNVSHELKTPLTNIREAVSLLLESEEMVPGSQNHEIATILQDNSLRLQAMIEELLRFGSEGDIYAGPQHPSLALDALVLETVERQSIAAQARDISLVTELTPVEMPGNPKQLQLVVDNLLSNAIKYTPPGGRVSIHLQRHASEVCLEVQDTGPGIAPEQRKQVFDWFFKGRPPPDRLVSGTGMGLAIAREYAHRHAGELYLLESEGGAHFRLTLPIKDNVHET